MKRFFYLLVSLFLLISNVAAQKKFSREQLIADVDTLYTQMYDIHPNLFAVYSQTEFEEGLADAKSQFKDSMTAIDFYRLITPLVVELKDGHTTIFPPNSSLDKERKLLFPLIVEINKRDSSITMKEDYSNSDHTIPTGAKILSINGRETKDILNTFLTYASGENNLFKFERVQLELSLLPYLVYGDSTFVVRYADKTNNISKPISIKGISFNKYMEEKEKKQVAEMQLTRKNYSLAIDNVNNTAIIDFHSFSAPPFCSFS